MGSVDASKQNVYMYVCLSACHPRLDQLTDRNKHAGEQTLRVKWEVGGNKKTQHNRWNTKGKSKREHGKRKRDGHTQGGK